MKSCNLCGLSFNLVFSLLLCQTHIILKMKIFQKFVYYQADDYTCFLTKLKNVIAFRELYSFITQQIYRHLNDLICCTERSSQSNTKLYFAFGTRFVSDIYTVFCIFNVENYTEWSHIWLFFWLTSVEMKSAKQEPNERKFYGNC